jgi:hypothetical protein
MKQPEDTRTAELPLDQVAQRRGRGRPAKADALTAAQRAKRYRDARRSAGGMSKAAETEQIKRDATKKEWDRQSIERHTRQVARISQLEEQLRLAEAERNAAYKANRELKEQLELAQANIQVSHISTDATKDAMQDKIFALEEKLAIATKEVKRLTKNEKSRDASQKKKEAEAS